MSVSLYRKYRPQNFASVVGQKSAVDVLTRSIERERVGHAYLFSGSRGCGKTSIARIFAKALNCLDRQGFEPCEKCRKCLDITSGDSLDVIEIDGASNNGVENIRGLKENVTLAPFSSRYKIYIIDEVHMLSQGAFNALLKTLEEPPEHVIFIMATTEPHKVPVTIRSRCQHIPFHSITPDDIFSRLDYVCKSENITAEPEALREIARQSDGALRDALSLLEQAASSGDVTVERVESIFGAGSRPSFERWLCGLRENPEGAYTGLKAMFDAGASGVRIFEEMFSLVRDLWLVSKWNTIANSLSLSEEDKKFLLAESKNWKPEELHALLKTILKILTQARFGIRPDILLGMFAVFLEGGEQPEAPRYERPRMMKPRIENEIANEEKPIVPEPVPKIEIETVNEDTALKEELLTIAEGKNFMIYCALFDARPCRRGNDVVLDMAHKYCYEIMRVDRNASQIAGIFEEYGNIFLKFGPVESQCQKFIELEELPKRKESKQKKTASIVFDELEQPREFSPSSSSSSSASKNPFSDLMNKLRSVGLKPEMILMKHNEPSESEQSSQEAENLESEEAEEDD